MSIHPNIATRKSILAFSDKKVDDATLNVLFEAARWAPSAFNEQPWRFIVARQGETGFEELVECLAEANRSWAKNAGLLFLTLVKHSLTQNGATNRHALHDLGLAVGNITFQAKEHGIELHQMGGFDTAKAFSTFQIPDGFEPITIIAGGYPGSLEGLSEQLKTRANRPRTRKSPHELVFSGSFGHPHPVVIHPTQPN